MADLVSIEARRRNLSHIGHATRRDLAAGNGDLIGLRGESAFANKFKLQIDLTSRPAGDGGVDFWLKTTHGTYPVDVKTYVIPYRLLIEAKKCKPLQIYVLAKYYPELDAAELLGWQWGAILMQTEARDYGGKGIISYAIPASRIRKIEELLAIAGPA